MKYILLIVFVSTNGFGGTKTETTQLEFNSYQSCLIAADKIKEDHKWDWQKPTLTCVAK